MIPKKPVPHLVRGGNRFSEKIMLQQRARAGWRLEEKSSCSSPAASQAVHPSSCGARRNAPSLEGRQPVPAVRYREIEIGADWHDPAGINRAVALIIVMLDV